MQPSATDAGDMTVMLRLSGGDAVSLRLLRERCALVPSASALLLADTHLGKSAAMRAKGVPVPSGPGRACLERLEAVADRVRPARVIVLGDLLHAPTGVTDELHRLVRSATDRLGAMGARVELVPGNHDRKLGQAGLERLCGELGIVLRPPEVRLEDAPGLVLVHDAADALGAAFAIGGHLHPAAVLRGGGDAVRLPAALLGARRLVLPAFGSFVSGVRSQPEAGERLLAFGPRGVFDAQ
ncbi:MAG: metallophosphoesterase [Planctomycetota bacterium]